MKNDWKAHGIFHESSSNLQHSENEVGIMSHWAAGHLDWLEITYTWLQGQISTLDRATALDKEIFYCNYAHDSDAFDILLSSANKEHLLKA